MRTASVEDVRSGLKNPQISRKKAIRNKCLDCTNGQIVEVKECAEKICPLYPFRMGGMEGKAPDPRKGKSLSPEHLAKMQAASKKYRAEKSN